MNQVSALLARYDAERERWPERADVKASTAPVSELLKVADDLAAALRASPVAHADKALTEDQATIHVTKAEQEAIDLWVATCNCGWREEFTAPNPNRPSLAERYAVAAAGCHAEYEEARIARREDLAAIVLCNLLPEGSPSRDAMHSTRLSGIPLATLANLVVEKLSARVSEDQGSKSEAPTVDELMRLADAYSLAVLERKAGSLEAVDAARAILRTALESALGNRERLIEAVKAVYYAAHWTPDRDVDAAAPWTELRDAAGLEPGRAPEPSPQEPSGNDLPRPAGEIRALVAEWRFQSKQLYDVLGDFPEVATARLVANRMAELWERVLANNSERSLPPTKKDG